MAGDGESNSQSPRFFSGWMFAAIIIILAAGTVTVWASRETYEGKVEELSAFLSLTWIIAALIVTLILTYRSNAAVIGEANKRPGKTGGLDPIKLASGLNHSTLGLTVVVIGGAVLAMYGIIPDWLVHAFAGPVLVFFVTVFDWLFFRIKRETCDTLLSNGGDDSDLADAQSECWEALAVLRIVDLPILVGIVVVFVSGMCIQGANSYVCGFLGGATAFQLLVGNLSFSAIQNLRNPMDLLSTVGEGH